MEIPTPTIRCPAPALAPGMQGIARVAVDDANAQLIVTFLVPITAQQAYLFNPSSYSLTGGQRFFPRILRAGPVQLASPPGPSTQALLTLDMEGDFSIYTLTVSGPDIDPFFGSVRLRFRLACDDAFDCAAPATPAPSPSELPVAIDYLARDYSSFRQALLDFVPTRFPSWTERSEADIGMVLLELFAATADNLSYLQDRVANEAFLSTATQRRSVAGHLALLGYQMDEGASAYTWLQFQVKSAVTLNAAFKVSTDPAATNEPVVAFETLVAEDLNPAHNQMQLYDWGNADCCLPRTQSSASLAGRFDRLKAGDYLVFDSGRGKRDVVRLTAAPRIVTLALPTSPPSTRDITTVSWSQATPLAFDHCVAQTTVRGNLVPATHGETVQETLRSYTDQQKLAVEARIAARPPSQRVARQRLALSRGPLAHLDPQTQMLGAPIAALSAAVQPGGITDRPPRSISTLAVLVDGATWLQRQTLLESQPDDTAYRVEIDDAGNATVVFGDDVFGQRPSETSEVEVVYRIGGGSIGNIGADTLTQAHPDGLVPWLTSVTNPVPARGGRDLESRDHARRTAPASFRQPLAAVTADDYRNAAVAYSDASGNALIQRANAEFRWTGSWLAVTLAVDPLGTQGLSPALAEGLRLDLGRKRLSGYDLEIVGPDYVPLEIAIGFTATASAQQGDVQEALLLALSNGVRPDGTTGFFHPDNFTFGDALYVSRLFAAVMAVPGVASAQITRLARLHGAQPDAETAANLAQGFLAIGANQIVRVDNDRNFPQNGTLSVTAMGASA